MSVFLFHTNRKVKVVWMIIFLGETRTGHKGHHTQCQMLSSGTVFSGVINLHPVSLGLVGLGL